MAEFIEINGDLFNIDKIQALKYCDQKNSLGNDNGVYILEIHMERGIGSMSKGYDSKKIRDEDFQLARTQLMEKRNLIKGYACKQQRGEKDMKKSKTIWCYIDGKKHCDVTAWALAANVDIKTAKEMLTAQYPGMSVTFKVV